MTKDLKTALFRNLVRCHDDVIDKKFGYFCNILK